MQFSFENLINKLFRLLFMLYLKNEYLSFIRVYIKDDSLKIFITLFIR